MSHKLPHSDAPTGVAPPHAQLIQMATAYWVSRAVYAAAKLDLADHLAGGPKSAADLAVPTSTRTVATPADARARQPRRPV